jgi:hypothetical protein
MEFLSRARLLDHHGGRHLASEPHIRIQVQPVPVRASDGAPFFTRYHGELLIHCVQGACRVETERAACELAQGDQVLLFDGEGFRIDRSNEHDAIVQLIWTPGPNPCRTCWETDDNFFRTSGG